VGVPGCVCENELWKNETDWRDIQIGQFHQSGMTQKTQRQHAFTISLICNRIIVRSCLWVFSANRLGSRIWRHAHTFYYFARSLEENIDATRLNHQSGPSTMKTVHASSHTGRSHLEFCLGILLGHHWGACSCVSLGNVLGPPRRMDNKMQHKPICFVFQESAVFLSLIGKNLTRVS
jgi:hypothetical protein